MRILASADEFHIEQEFGSPFLAIVDGEDNVRCVLDYEIFLSLAEQVLGVN
jgi:hypothetical protein